MKVWIVGSGTLIPNEKRGGAAHWVEAGGSSFLLDCGPGTLGTLAELGLPWGSLGHILLTHFHTDHVADLAPLLFALKNGSAQPRTRPLTLLGPPGLLQHLNALAEAHGAFILNPGFPLKVQEISPGGDWGDPEAGILIRTWPARHTPQSLAIRLESPEGILGYTGDTGFLEGLGEFFRGCGTLIAECSHPDEMEMDTHLSPGKLAVLAGNARPDVLVTVHAYPPLEPLQIPGLLAEAGYSGWVLPGWDGLELDLAGGETREVEKTKPKSISDAPERD